MIAEDLGITLEHMTMEDLGRATREVLITELPAKNETAPPTHPGGGYDEDCLGAASGVPRATDPGGEFNND
jgi:hypothetical protein